MSHDIVEKFFVLFHFYIVRFVFLISFSRKFKLSNRTGDIRDNRETFCPSIFKAMNIKQIIVFPSTTTMYAYSIWLLRWWSTQVNLWRLFTVRIRDTKYEQFMSSRSWQENQSDKESINNLKVSLFLLGIKLWPCKDFLQHRSKL